MAAVTLVAFLPIAHRVEPLVTVGVVAAILWVTIAIESIRHADARREIREAEHRRHERAD
jgi:hypothetical protein